MREAACDISHSSRPPTPSLHLLLRISFYHPLPSTIFPRPPLTPSSLPLLHHATDRPTPAACASRHHTSPLDQGSSSLSLPLLLTHSYSHTLLPHNRSPAAPSQQHPLAAGAPLLSSSIICYSIFLPLPSSLDSPACATTASHTALTAAASAANERINAVTLHQLQEDGRPSSLRKIYST